MGQLLEQLAQVPVRLAPVGLGGLDQAVQDRARLRSARASREEPVLAAHLERPDRLLAGVVVRRKLLVFQIADQLRPLAQREGDRLAERRAGSKPARLAPAPRHS